ncbi:MAG: hypothetical protein PHR06_01665, partial [Candidatus Cloacimonetes bacterium]|nr:hypothetical protein [Candidatus Cloacimonadota bacterium]
MKKYCIVILLSLISSLIYAQIEVDAYVNKTKIGIQDTFEYVLEISGESGSNFKFDFPEFENIIAHRVIQHDFDTSPIDGDDGLGMVIDCDEQLAKKFKKYVDS